MAMTYEGFSIREYTMKMRIVDVVKCWPFDETLNKEAINSFLPPMRVQKFKCWSDELEHVTKADDIEVMEDELLEREKLGLSSLRKKRPPKKKRSIVEIFNVAPHAERLDYDEDYDDDSSNEGVNNEFLELKDTVKVVLKGKNKKKLKLKRGKVEKLKKKGKRKQRESAINLLVRSITKKEKSCKLSLQHPSGFTENPYASSYKGLTKDILNSVPVNKKKARPKCLTSEKKKKIGKNSKLFAKHRKPALSVRGIFKNVTKVFLGQDSTACNLQDDTGTNEYVTRLSDGHVGFSGKNDVLGLKRKCFPSSECPNFDNICSSYSDATAATLETGHFEERGNNLADAVVNGCADNSAGTENEISVQPNFLAEENLSPSNAFFAIDKPNSLMPHIACQEQLFDRRLNVNQESLHSEDVRLFEQGYRAASHETLYACAPGYIPHAYTQVPSHNRENFIDHSGDPRPRFSAVPSSSYFGYGGGNAHGGLPFPAQNYNYEALPFQPKELMCSACSHPYWNQRGMISCKGKCMDDGFVGLPLNSQGELMQLNSSGKGGFTQLLRPNSHGYGHPNLSNFDMRPPPSPLENPFPVQQIVRRNPNFLVSSRLGCERRDVPLLDYMTENNESFYLLEPEFDLMNVNTHQHRQYDPVESTQITQPTMRLMGKEFTVARNNMVGEHHFIHPASSGKEKETVALSENQASQSVFFNPYLSCQNNGTIYGNHLSPPPALFNRPPVFQDPYSCNQYDSVRVDPGIPILQEPTRNFLNATENQQKLLPHSTKSAFPFPFSCPSNETLIGSVNSFQTMPCNFRAPEMSSNCPASLAHPKFIPVSPGFIIPTSAINNRREYMMKFKAPKKRPATKSNVSSKATKLPNLEIQARDDARGVDMIQHRSGAFDLDSSNDKSYRVECGQNATQMDAGGRFFPSKPDDGMTRPGPIRLIGGAKHILIPSQNMDQSNCRLTHSAMPLATAVTRVSESEMDTARIYRF